MIQFNTNVKRITSGVFLFIIGVLSAEPSVEAEAAAKKQCKGTSDAEFASCCHAAWTSYDSAKAAYESPTPTYVNWVWDTIISSDTNVPYTTLCDGFPRAMKPFGATRVYSTKSTPTPTSYSTIYISKTYKGPAPTCSINEADCVPYANAWSSSYSSWKTNQSLPYPTETLHCSTYLACPTKSPADGDQVCKLYAEGATIYYWPVTTTGDFCGVHSTLTPRASSRTTVISGNTFVSPTAYMRIRSASAARHNGKYSATPCGYGRKNILLTFPHASQISTRHWKPGTTSNTTPLDVGDLNTPFPASAYFTGQPTVCTTTSCPTIGGDYTPTLDIPMALMTADPEWTQCTPRSEGIEDPTFIPLEPVSDNWPKPTKTRAS